jgi:DNA-binding transcriptional LysR family regulator
MDRLQGIELFIRVVETGSFSKASADLGITQPTATKHIAALEQRLGARLPTAARVASRPPRSARCTTTSAC